VFKKGGERTGAEVAERVSVGKHGETPIQKRFSPLLEEIRG